MIALAKENGKYKADFNPIDPSILIEPFHWLDDLPLGRRCND